MLTGYLVAFVGAEAALRPLPQAAAPATGFRRDVRLDDGWESVRVNRADDVPPTAGWAPAAIPEIVFVPAPGARTSLWYRRTVPVNRDGRTILRFDSAGKSATVLIDGKVVDRWFDGFSPRRVDLTPHVAGRSEVVVHVRCGDRADLYADGFVPPAGSPESAIEGKVLWAIGGYKDGIGLSLPVTWEARPNVHLADAAFRILTSVRRGAIEVRGRAPGAAGGWTVDLAAVDRDGRTQPIGPATLDAEGGFQLERPFAGARLWSPEDPHLYRLTATLRDPAGTVRDRAEVRFGFREVWVDGPNFFLNGVRRNLLATSTWPATVPMSRAEVERRLRAVKASNAIAFRLHIGPWQKEFREVADEIGLMIVEEGPHYTDGSGYYAYADARFWRNWEQTLAGLVEWNFNHPSVVMWSLGNEILFMGNGRRYAPLPQRLGDLARYVRRLDPSRPLTFEADLDPDGAYDVIGLHYPHELPNQHAYPVIADWLAERKETEAGGGMLGQATSSFEWDRKKPLYIGEYLWVPYGDYSPGSVFYGPRAYTNRDHYNHQARLRSWHDQTIAYRRAGVTGLTPWTAFGFGVELENPDSIAAQTEFYRPIAAFPRFRALRAFAGDEVELTFDVFNESPQARKLRLSVSVPGASAEMMEDVELEPGETAPATFRLRVPGAANGPLKGVATLSDAEGEHDRRPLALEVSRRAGLRAPAGRRLVEIVDPAKIATVSGLDPARDVVVVGAGVMDAPPTPQAGGRPVVGAGAPDGAPLREFVRRGGRAVVLEHRSLAALGLPVPLTDHQSTMAFADAEGWPDLRWWGRDMIVANRQIVRNGGSGLRSLATTGGGQSLAQAPIGLLRFGRGAFVFVQMTAGAKRGEDPAALAAIQRATDVAAAEAPMREGSVLAVGGDAALRDRLAAVGLDVVPAGASDPGGPISGVVVADARLPEWLAARIRRDGLPVLWQVGSGESYAANQSALGVAGLSYTAGAHTAAWVGHDPLLTGVTAGELAWTTPPVGWDRITQPRAGTAAGRFAPAARAAVAPAVVPSARFDGRQSEREGDRLLVRRRTPIEAEFVSPAAGWAELEVVSDAENAPLISVFVDGVRQDWVVPTGSVARTMVKLPQGRVRIGLQLDNAQTWALDGPAFRLREVRIHRPTAWPGDARPLAAPGTLATWTVGRSTVVATTLRPAALTANPRQAERLFGALAANLGMRFEVPETPSGETLPLERFQIESGAFNSARSGWLEMRSTGTAAMDVFVARGGRFAVDVEAESSPAAGEYAEFALEVDGAEVARGRCAGPGPAVVRLPAFALAAGPRTVRVRFLNDASAPGEDRNLFIRRIEFRRAD